MTTNATIGLISAICLGLVILWDYFRRKNGKTDYSHASRHDNLPDYGVEEGEAHQVFPKPFYIQWGNGPILEYANDWEINHKDDVPTHEKVLEDIKKVEDIHLPTSEQARDVFRYMNEVGRTKKS